MNRRAFLRAGVGGLAATLAGCSSGGQTTRTTDGIRLESVDVGASPGGTISIRPAETVVLLDFFATWCAPCAQEMANLRAARARFDRDRVFVVSITQETDEQAIETFWNRHRGTWPVVVDADLEATRAYDVTGVPTIIVLTAAGERVMRHTGLAGETKIVDALEEAITDGGQS